MKEIFKFSAAFLTSGLWSPSEKNVAQAEKWGLDWAWPNAEVGTDSNLKKS